MNRNEGNRELWSSNNTTKVKYRPTKTSRIHTKRTKTHIFSTLQAEKCFLHLLVQKQVLFFVFIMIYILSYFFKYWFMLLNSALDSTFLKNLLPHFWLQGYTAFISLSTPITATKVLFMSDILEKKYHQNSTFSPSTH